MVFRFTIGRTAPGSLKRLVVSTMLTGILGLAPSFLYAQTMTEQTDRYTALWKSGDYKGAIEEIDRLLDEHVSAVPIKWSVDRAELYYETGQIDKAIEELENLQRTRYLPPPEILRLALLYKERGRKEEFLQTLGRAAERANRLTSYGYRIEAGLILTQGRIAELQGQNPKTILNSLYGEVMKQMPDYAPGFVAAGNLAYRKWDYNLAAQYYEKALKIEEDNQDALAGLAECYWKSNNALAEKIMERLLSLNPHHYRAWAIQAEMALDVGRTQEALEIIDASLAVNPYRLRMLALRAAAFFLEDNLTSMTEPQGRALGINPEASAVYRVPGRIASRHYRFHEGVKMQRRALEIDPDDYRARAYLAFDLLRLGEEEEGREQLEKAFEADKYNVTVFNMLKLLDSLDRFQTIERGPFLLQMPEREAPIFAEDALALLEEAVELYSKKYDIELAEPIRIQIFDNHDDFMVRSVGLPGSVGHLGICFGQLVTMDSPTARPKYEANWKSVLWHEFVHVITLQKSAYRMPRWLSEGISVYEETQREAAWGQRLSLEYKAIVDNEPLPGILDLEKSFTNPKSAMHLMFGYLAAGEFVRFYVERYGFDALKESLERIASGERTPRALSKSAGVSRKKLDAGFKESFKKRLAPFDNVPSFTALRGLKLEAMDGASSLTAIRAADRSTTSPLFTTAMTSASRALEAKNWDEAEKALKLAYEAFPDYMGADAPLRQLISLYERQDQKKELRETLRKQIAWNSTDFASCRKLADLYVENEQWPQAIDVTETALGIDPFDVGMRRTALDGRLKTGDREKALKLLDILPLIDPTRAIDYRLGRIETLCDLERWPEAKKETVQLLEESPHFWEAQKALLRIVERDSEKQKNRKPPPPAEGAGPVSEKKEK